MGFKVEQIVVKNINVSNTFSCIICKLKITYSDVDGWSKIGNTQHNDAIAMATSIITNYWNYCCISGHS